MCATLHHTVCVGEARWEAHPRMAAPFWRDGPRKQGRGIRRACMGGHHLTLPTYLSSQQCTTVHLSTSRLKSVLSSWHPRDVSHTHLLGTVGPLRGAFRVCTVAGNGDERTRVVLTIGTYRYRQVLSPCRSPVLWEPPKPNWHAEVLDYQAIVSINQPPQ